MRKKVMTACSALLLAFGLVSLHATSVAAADPPTILIRATVVDAETNQPVEGATVTVHCGGHLVFTTKTGKNGSLLMAIKDPHCIEGVAMTITATSGNKSAMLAVKITGKEITGILRLAKGTAIPEYGWLGGIVAGGMAIVAIAFVRRRQVSDI